MVCIHNIDMYMCTLLKQEFRAIGIKKQGFVLRLEKAAKMLPAMVIETKVPVRILLHFFSNVKPCGHFCAKYHI